MADTSLTTQLGRIEEIQAQLRSILLSESLESVDELLAEKRSRLKYVLELRDNEEFSGRATYARLVRILRNDHELQGLITRQLQVLSTELKKTHEAQQLTGAYLAAPAAAASARLLSDVSI